MSCTHRIAGAAWGLLLSLSMTAAAEAAPAPPPPTPDQIKACLAQIGPQWRLDWKVLEIGKARPPLNNYEAMNTSALGQSRPGPGYPIHVVYRVNDQWTIDSEYFVIKNAADRWQIPGLCVVPQ
jgi:hypothetical protein